MKPFDGTKLFIEHDKRLKRQGLLLKRECFFHRKRGKKIITLKDEIQELLKEYKYTDYGLGSDGEEYSEYSFDYESATNGIIRFLEIRGVLKYLL